jgi:hypothetical protein
MKNLYSLSVLFLLVLLLTSCSKEEESKYYYEVTGTGSSFDVTIEGAPSGTAQFSDVHSGWRYSWTQTGTRWLYISAQNTGSSGSVTVKIVCNNNLKAKQTSNGAYVIASVSGEY